MTARFKKRKAWRAVEFVPVYQVGEDVFAEVRAAQGQRRPMLDELLGGLMVRCPDKIGQSRIKQPGPFANIAW